MYKLTITFFLFISSNNVISQVNINLFTLCNGCTGPTYQRIWLTKCIKKDCYGVALVQEEAYDIYPTYDDVDIICDSNLETFNQV